MKIPKNSPKNWLVRIKHCKSPRIRLVCFPFGGGSAASFWNWQSKLAHDIELWAVRLPGRETRITERFITDANKVVESISEEIKYLRDVQFVFYGHSLGAGLACQTAKLLRLNGETLPSLLIASGRLPPHYPYTGSWAHQPEKELIDHLMNLGGIPTNIIKNEPFLSAYLPKIRADFELNETLFYGHFSAFDFPITVINGINDPLVSEKSLQEWQNYTNGEFKAFKINGGHFFIQSHFNEFISILSDQLAGLSVAEDVVYARE